MKVLIVGGGGREHAIALKIKENPEVTALCLLLPPLLTKAAKSCSVNTTSK